METGEIFTSRDVIFHEDACSFSKDKREEVLENLDPNLEWTPKGINDEFWIARSFGENEPQLTSTD